METYKIKTKWNYKIVDDFHTSFLVEDHFNRAVEI